MDEIDPKSPHVQTALAMAALAVAFADTLEELAPRAEALLILQRKVQVAQAKLRQTPDAEVAAAIFGVVRDALRNSNVIKQPDDDGDIE
jgi:copper(I)-binding protein